ncbi:DUF6624 domain-containing protein [Xanthomonas hortorum]|uniref:Uncharacterized protein n=1 Tax=Xanthomonas hortorum pv. hederae TaxID=453603 RepID=A0A9X4BVI1_9XANT|nr:DUF6624 domain-containing protein [Xanthomonas hortorum]MCE4373411.1 hypothetical protein [Xanthomonas hortorum pv. hederae]MDC8640355.1 hypothetical protein [Xanthomonas hortorum pv. hederae]PPU75966.1 hypothetical protein XhhCFBP4925_20775 [Xanthomonas hortorum pv. hederae]PUE95647.1 hypothetical protein C7T87_21400 [Xanthomonas hortorum pv. hederae]
MRIAYVSIYLGVALGLAGALHAGEVPDVFAALKAYKANDYARCAEVMEALQRSSGELPQNGELLRAECLAAAKRTDEAMRYLEEEIPRGRISIDDLRSKDRPGLNRLRTMRGWPVLLAKAERISAQHRAALNPQLRQELLARVEKDQHAQNAAIAAGGKQADWASTVPVMRENTEWLKQVVATRGWPGRRLVGEDGANAAWTLIQHSDADPAFQAQVLALMEAALARQDVAPDDVALLTDRVLRAQGKPQRYGTQFQTGADGRMSLQPTEDEAGLDARRRSMGLPPMNQYKKMLHDVYQKPVR